MQVYRALPVLALSLFATPAAAQCDVRYPLDPPGIMQTYSGEARGGGVLIVPIVVHIHYGGGVQPLGALQVQDLIDEVNIGLRGQNPDIVDVVPAFASLVGDMGIELQFATRDDNGECMSGIRYHLYDPSTGWPNDVPVTLNTRQYLNIHIRPSINSFATLPGLVSAPYDPTDVIVLSGPLETLARTLIHEVGHWSGLLHVWGWGTTGVCGDDGIADTPITAGSQLDCILDQDDCTEGVVENVQNHMDYSNCRLMFTEGQAQYANAVLADPLRVRAGVVDPANLESTGITDPASCPITAGIYHRASISCAGTTMSYRAMAEHALADSVRWTFPNGEPATSTSDNALVMYETGGDHLVQLTVYGGGGSATVSELVYIDVPDPTGNGLSVISSFPFTEDFENGFTLPQPNMFAEASPSPTWQPTGEAGFASDHSLYVPAAPVDVADTNDLIIGNFDLSGLAQPTIQVRVAATAYQFSVWQTLQVRFRDLCSNIFMGDVWAQWGLNEMAADHGPNYTPGDDNEWYLLTYTNPVWNLGTSVQLGLRLVRPWAPPTSFTPEKFYVDDVYVGELPVTAGVSEMHGHGASMLVPNPTTGAFAISAQAATDLSIMDALGQVVWQQRVNAGRTTIDAPLSRGIYLVRLGGARQAVRLVVE